MAIICDICGKSDFKSTQALHGHKMLTHADTIDRSWKLAIGASIFSAWEVLSIITLLEREVKRCNEKKEVEKINFLKDTISKLQEVTVGQKPVNFKVDF